jgi:glycosyltransferase involved in cell wall biosynthesis
VVHVTTVPQTLFFLAGQPAYFRERGVDFVAVSSPGAELDRFRSSERVRCFAVPMERRITPLRDLVALARLVRILRTLRPDVVDAHTPKGGLLGMVAAALARVPVRVYHVHGLPLLTASGARRLLLGATERAAALLATRVLYVSPSLAEAASAERLAPKSRMGVILGGSIGGVDATGRFRAPTAEQRRAARSALGIPADALVVGFVGRLVRDKGIAELAHAWRLLRDEFPALRLLLVGAREPQDPVPAGATAALRGDPRVAEVGFDLDVPKYFRAMDVLALPTHREGFGNVLLEAAAMSLPTVATQVTGCVDAVVDGVTGVLVPPRDPEALATALRAYLRDPALRERHGRAGRERALREFDRHRIWDALHAEYAKLLAAERPPPLRATRAQWT